MLKTATIVTGAISALVWAMPSLVIMGFFLLVVPGMVLAAMPTVFAYLFATLVIRMLLPIDSQPLATGIAFSIALAIGWAVMQPWRMAAQARFAEADLADIVPSGNVALSGDVLWEEEGLRSKQRDGCDGFCLAILDQPGVTSLTRVVDGRTRTFKLIDASPDDPPGIVPFQPGDIAHLLPRDAEGGPGAFEQTKQAERDIAASWAQRLASRERLVEVETPASYGWTIRSGKERSADRWSLDRVEVSAANGETVYRRSYLRGFIPARIFHFGFEGGSAVSGFTGAHFHVGRDARRSGSAMLDNRSHEALFDVIDLSRAVPAENLVDTLRSDVAAMLDNPASTQASLEIAERWLDTKWFDVTPAEIPLIAAIWSDPRIKDLPPLNARLFSSNKPAPPQLAKAFAKRIAMPDTSPQQRQHLALVLAGMPDGTFAAGDAQFMAIWNSEELRRDAGPFVARMADLGAQRAVPALLKALEISLPYSPWNSKRSLVEGVRNGFIRLGPGASEAVPRIKQLMAQRSSPIMNRYHDWQEWLFALALMGVPLDELPFLDHQDEEDRASERERLARRLAEYAAAAAQP